MHRISVTFMHLTKPEPVEQPAGSLSASGPAGWIAATSKRAGLGFASCVCAAAVKTARAALTIDRTINPPRIYDADGRFGVQGYGTDHRRVLRLTHAPSAIACAKPLSDTRTTGITH